MLSQSTLSWYFSMKFSDSFCSEEIRYQSTLSWYFSMKFSDSFWLQEMLSQSILSWYFSMKFSVSFWFKEIHFHPTLSWYFSMKFSESFWYWEILSQSTLFWNFSIKSSERAWFWEIQNQLKCCLWREYLAMDCFNKKELITLSGRLCVELNYIIAICLVFALWYKATITPLYFHHYCAPFWSYLLFNATTILGAYNQHE